MKPRPIRRRARGADVARGETSYLFEEPFGLNVMAILPQLKAAGVTALKIEGRQRSRAYVAEVVGQFRPRSTPWRAASRPPRPNPGSAPSWKAGKANASALTRRAGGDEGKAAKRGAKPPQRRDKSRLTLGPLCSLAGGKAARLLFPHRRRGADIDERLSGRGRLLQARALFRTLSVRSRRPVARAGKRWFIRRFALITTAAGTR